MGKCCGCSSESCYGWIAIVVTYFIINFRVEAGIATLFERTLDGLVGGVVFLLLLYAAGRFYGVIEIADNKGLFSRCQKKE